MNKTYPHGDLAGAKGLDRAVSAEVAADRGEALHPGLEGFIDSRSGVVLVGLSEPDYSHMPLTRAWSG